MAKNKRMRAAVSFMGVVVAITQAQVQIPKIALATHYVRPGPGVKVKRLSDYFSGIARTPGDTVVYIMEGAEPGDPVSDGAWPLAKRVGIHLAALGAILGAYNETVEEKGRLKIGNLPKLEEMTKAGLGTYLR